MPNVQLSVIDRKYVHSATFGQLSNDVTAINELLKVLSKNNPRQLKDRMELIRIAIQENIRLVVARDLDINGQDAPNIVGMASVHWTELPTKVNAYIDDVVVLDTYQGQKIGKKLTEELIRIARSVNAACVDLTSNPSRIAANAMYIKFGFEKKDTNYYRLKL